MAENNEQAIEAYHPVVHTMSVLLTVVVFPLIWVGGLVTTYDAGMAVPDWPGTYGWNMFAYPAATWLYGPFDLMVEHGHRLLGSLAGLLAIGLVIAAVKWDARGWFRAWCGMLLLAVIAQGFLGGLRVLQDQRIMALVHGCTGSLFFALTTAAAVMCSRWWLERARLPDRSHEKPPVGQYATAPAVAWTATLLVLASYLQLIMGAQLRHVTGVVGHRKFTMLVHLHLTLAVVVLLLAVVLLLQAWLRRRTPGKVRSIATVLTFAVVAQIALGVGTWVVNYALPWPELTEGLTRYTIQSKGHWESLIVTAHVAIGALIVSLSTVATLRSWRSRAQAT